MPVRPEDFYATRREKIRPKLRALAEFVVRDYLKLSVAGRGVRQHRGRKGRAIVVEPQPPSFRGAFAVSLRAADRTATIGIGRVNGFVPTIGGVTLDGKDPATGRPHRSGVPVVEISGHHGFSFLALAVRVNTGTGRIDFANRDAISVVHVGELDPLYADGPGSGGVPVGLHPIAELEWDTEGAAPVRVRQMVFFDQAHRYIPGVDGVGRHVFGGAE